MNVWPPIPEVTGSEEPSANAVATAASTALPPASRIAAPAWAASGEPQTTMPLREVTSAGRSWSGYLT